jgi:hypothetical protein
MCVRVEMPLPIKANRAWLSGPLVLAEFVTSWFMKVVVGTALWFMKVVVGTVLWFMKVAVGTVL